MATLNSGRHGPELAARAHQLLQALRQLDHEGVIAGDPAARAQLARILRELPGDESGTAVPARRERQRLWMGVLQAAGMGERLGKLYDSEAVGRIVAFRDVPHRLGLPPFDLVVAPDFNPIAGYHAILIGGDRVSSCVLRQPCATSEWQVRETHAFDSAEGLVDLVGALAVGMPVTSD